MATEFQMPKLGLTMEAGTIIGWHVANGAAVEAGTPVLSIETDKVETDVEASASGRLHQIGAPGETFACGKRIAWFLAEGEEAPAAPTSSASTVPASPVAGVAAERPAGTDPGSPAAAPPLSPASTAGGPPAAAASAGSASRAWGPPAASASGVQPASGQGGRILSSPNARRVAAELEVDLAIIAGSGPGGRIVAADVQRFVGARPEPVSEDAQPSGGARTEPVSEDVQPSIGARQEPVSEGVEPSVGARPAPIPDTGVPVVASLAARRLADLLGVDIAAVPRTGVDPRVTRDDVALYVRQRLAGPGPAPAPAPPAQTPVPRAAERQTRPSGSAAASTPPAQAPVPRAAERQTRPSGSAPALAPPSQTPSSVVRMRGMRATIASRMHESLHDMAQLTLTMDVAMDRVVADRERRQVDGDAPSYTDYVIAAAAAALVEHPIVNSQIVDEGVALLPEVNVGMAVALDNGLVVPVVRGADRLSIEEMSVEAARLAAAARSRSLGLPDFEGATFTVTAMGMYGVDAFTPIINPPNTAILGVGRVRRDVDWDDDDRPVPLPVLTLSLTWDHRAFDGAPAAEFTRTVREALESWGDR